MKTLEWYLCTGRTKSKSLQVVYGALQDLTPASPGSSPHTLPSFFPLVSWPFRNCKSPCFLNLGSLNRLPPAWRDHLVAWSTLPLPGEVFRLCGAPCADPSLQQPLLILECLHFSPDTFPQPDPASPTETLLSPFCAWLLPFQISV